MARSRSQQVEQRLIAGTIAVLTTFSQLRQREAGKDLTDYNMEQQASIVQDRFTLQHEPGAEFWSNCLNIEYGAQRMALYDQVLAKFDADPSYAKQAQFPAAGANKKPKPPAN